MAEGTIDAIATDHAPHTAEEKHLGSKNVWKAPTGYPALEVSLAIGLERVRRGGRGEGSLGLARLVELMSAAPAKIAGIHPEIGIDPDWGGRRSHAGGFEEGLDGQGRGHRVPGGLVPVRGPPVQGPGRCGGPERKGRDAGPGDPRPSGRGKVRGPADERRRDGMNQERRADDAGLG